MQDIEKELIDEPTNTMFNCDIKIWYTNKIRELPLSDAKQVDFNYLMTLVCQKQYPIIPWASEFQHLAHGLEVKEKCWEGQLQWCGDRGSGVVKAKGDMWGEKEDKNHNSSFPVPAQETKIKNLAIFHTNHHIFIVYYL